MRPSIGVWRKRVRNLDLFLVAFGSSLLGFSIPRIELSPPILLSLNRPLRVEPPWLAVCAKVI